MIFYDKSVRISFFFCFLWPGLHIQLPAPGAWPKEYGETSFALGERDEIDAKAAKGDSVYEPL